VFATFLYVIANGALDWGPAVRHRRNEAAVDPGRTSRSTIRKVGLEGRLDGDDVGGSPRSSRGGRLMGWIANVAEDGFGGSSTTS
jgi:hypothetical protein